MSLCRTPLRRPRRRGRRGPRVLGHRHAHPGGGRHGRRRRAPTPTPHRGKNGLTGAGRGHRAEADGAAPRRPRDPRRLGPRQDAPRPRHPRPGPRASTTRGLPIGIICHGGSVAISAGIVGARATGSLGIKDDLVNAGAEWVDEPAFRDGTAGLGPRGGGHPGLRARAGGRPERGRGGRAPSGALRRPGRAVGRGVDAARPPSRRGRRRRSRGRRRCAGSARGAAAGARPATGRAGRAARARGSRPAGAPPRRGRGGRRPAGSGTTASAMPQR